MMEGRRTKGAKLAFLDRAIRQVVFGFGIRYVVVEETEQRRGGERCSRERFWFTNELEERANASEGWLRAR